MPGRRQEVTQWIRDMREVLSPDPVDDLVERARAGVVYAHHVTLSENHDTDQTEFRLWLERRMKIRDANWEVLAFDRRIPDPPPEEREAWLARVQGSLTTFYLTDEEKRILGYA